MSEFNNVDKLPEGNLLQIKQLGKAQSLRHKRRVRQLLEKGFPSASK